MTYLDARKVLVNSVVFSNLFSQTVKISNNTEVIESVAKIDSFTVCERTAEDDGEYVEYSTKLTLPGSLTLTLDSKFYLPDEVIREIQDTNEEENKWWTINREMGIKRTHAGLIHVYIRMGMRVHPVGYNIRSREL